MGENGSRSRAAWSGCPPLRANFPSHLDKDVRLADYPLPIHMRVRDENANRPCFFGSPSRRRFRFGGRPIAEPAHPQVTRAEYERWQTEPSNWGRWGQDDELGTLNLDHRR